jgi:hypothetical protein
VYSSFVERSVSEKKVHDRQRGDLPRILEEVVLNPRQKIPALLAVAVMAEIKERVEMRKVIGLVAPFAPIGLIPCAIRPLVDAALDLMTKRVQPISIQGYGA